MTVSAFSATLDARRLALHDGHSRLLSAFTLLNTGDVLELLSEQDPKPLQTQLQSALPGQFSWEALPQGPDTWRVAITRLKAGHGDSGCCGGCGGA